MAFLIGGANSAADTGYDVANSCRFNHDDSAYMHKTPGTATNRKIFTISLWTKRSELYGVNSETKYMMSAGDNASTNIDEFYWRHDTLDFSGYESSTTEFQLRSNSLYRDMSAWYNIVIAYDSTQGTASNRIKVYVNGARVTSWATETYPDENHEPLFNSNIAHEIGRNGDAKYYDGYMAEFCFIDGSALAPTSFGEFDEDSPTIWKPIDVSGLTFGNNGFYLDFEDSSNLGNDKNGGTDLTEVNLAATDQATDTPTNNFCTMNPLASQSGSNASNDVVTFAEGNLDLSAIISESAVGTIGVAAGKWYWEVKVITTQDGIIIGGCNEHFHLDAELGYESPTSETGAKIFGYYGSNGNSFIAISDGTSQSYGAAINSNNNIIGVALDVDSADQTCTFYLNGSTQGSLDITNLDVGEFYFPAVGNWSASACAFSMNFGNPTYANSSSVADENGYGAFEYAPPSGYLALCTKNLGSTGG